MENKGKYSKQLLEEAVNASNSFAGVLRHLDVRVSGGMQAYIKRKVIEYEINFDHFNGQAWRKNKKFVGERRQPEHYLIKLPKGSVKTKTMYLRRSMVEVGMDYVCAECGSLPEWMGKPLTLQIDHIDGDNLNNLIENLRFLCPNCHCQTETWGSKNKSIP